MSRSRRKAPVSGNTCAESDKPYKICEHRRERRVVRSALLSGREAPAPKEFGNPWDAPKDGKHWVRAKLTPSILRK